MRKGKTLDAVCVQCTFKYTLSEVIIVVPSVPFDDQQNSENMSLIIMIRWTHFFSFDIMVPYITNATMTFNDDWMTHQPNLCTFTIPS